MELGIGITYVLKYDFSFFVMNTLLKTVGELMETMVREANTKAFEKYDGFFEKLKADKDPLCSFGMSVEG